ILDSEVPSHAERGNALSRAINTALTYHDFIPYNIIPEDKAIPVDDGFKLQFISAMADVPTYRHGIIHLARNVRENDPELEGTQPDQFANTIAESFHKFCDRTPVMVFPQIIRK